MDLEGARLLTYYLPTVPPPVHKYSSLRSTAHCAAAARYTHCAGSTLVKVQCQVLNR